MFEPIQYNDSKIHFGHLAESDFQNVLSENYPDSKMVIITDETVCELWIEDLITNYEQLKKAEIIQIPPGEESKTIEVCAQIWAALSEYEIGRGDLVINFGGGVITDLGGFVASLFKRGMQFINIPTTLLSQVDASVGGKTGVDLGPYKNQIGVFSDAAHVFIDDRYLETLPAEQLQSGYAEMLKHGLISDGTYWNDLLSFDPLVAEGMLAKIYQSVGIKKDIVLEDHKESGLRKNLNFGHTIGHGIEGYLLKNGQPTMHGYAVAWGMIAEAHISLSNGLISETDYNTIKEVLTEKYPKAPIAETDFKEINKLIYNDKKNKGSVIQCSLLSAIGSCVFDQEVTDKMILNALKELVN